MGHLYHGYVSHNQNKAIVVCHCPMDSSAKHPQRVDLGECLSQRLGDLAFLVGFVQNWKGHSSLLKVLLWWFMVIYMVIYGGIDGWLVVSSILGWWPTVLWKHDPQLGFFITVGHIWLIYVHYIQILYPGWWFQPSWKMMEFVSWEFSNMET